MKNQENNNKLLKEIEFCNSLMKYEVMLCFKTLLKESRMVCGQIGRVRF